MTSMTSFATSVGGDRDLHDDQPGSSRMSLIGENSSHLGYSTTGGRLSGFTGGVTGAFASTGRFSECATPRSTVTEVFRGQQALQVAVVGGDGGEAVFRLVDCPALAVHSPISICRATNPGAHPNMHCSL